MMSMVGRAVSRALTWLEIPAVARDAIDAFFSDWPELSADYDHVRADSLCGHELDACLCDLAERLSDDADVWYEIAHLRRLLRSAGVIPYAA